MRHGNFGILMRAGFLLLGIVFVLVACGVPRPVAVAPPAVEQPLGPLKEELFVLVQEERHRLDAKAKPLLIDPELMRAAQAHSEEMARKHSTDDSGPNGHFAINVLLADPKFGGYVAENAAAQVCPPAWEIDVARCARSIMASWLDSTDHRNNLAFPGFDRTGIGLAASGGTIYVSLVLAMDFGIARR